MTPRLKPIEAVFTKINDFLKDAETKEDFLSGCNYLLVKIPLYKQKPTCLLDPLIQIAEKLFEFNCFELGLALVKAGLTVDSENRVLKNLQADFECVLETETKPTPNSISEKIEKLVREKNKIDAKIKAGNLDQLGTLSEIEAELTSALRQLNLFKPANTPPSDNGRLHQLASPTPVTY